MRKITFYDNTADIVFYIKYGFLESIHSIVYGNSCEEIRSSRNDVNFNKVLKNALFNAAETDIQRFSTLIEAIKYDSYQVIASQIHKLVLEKYDI